MKRVIVESPFKATKEHSEEEHVRYARMCTHDCLKRGEAPFASHLFYTQEDILCDAIPEERRLGIKAGQVWGECAHLIAVYTDYGITDGMKEGIGHYKKLGIPIEYRTFSI